VLRTDLIQQGISEKVALCAQFLGAFATGFICTLDPSFGNFAQDESADALLLLVAYARSWRLSLAMTSILPCIAITGGIMQKFVSKYMRSVAIQMHILMSECWEPTDDRCFHLCMRASFLLDCTLVVVCLFSTLPKAAPLQKKSSRLLELLRYVNKTKLLSTSFFDMPSETPFLGLIR
jgi:hypothetical protein